MTSAFKSWTRSEEDIVEFQRDYLERVNKVKQSKLSCPVRSERV